MSYSLPQTLQSHSPYTPFSPLRAYRGSPCSRNSPWPQILRDGCPKKKKQQPLSDQAPSISSSASPLPYPSQCKQTDAASPPGKSHAVTSCENKPSRGSRRALKVHRDVLKPSNLGKKRQPHTSMRFYSPMTFLYFFVFPLCGSADNVALRTVFSLTAAPPLFFTCSVLPSPHFFACIIKQRCRGHVYERQRTSRSV